LAVRRLSKQEMGWYDHAKETESMATSVDDTEGVYFVPAFSGLAAPHQDPTARGTILGMTTSTKKQHLVRAMLESIVRWTTHHPLHAARTRAEGEA
jgi:glycerol kinase